MGESYCIKTHKFYGEKARRLLYSANLIVRDLKIIREGEYILIPVKEPREALEVLKNGNIDAVVCKREFPEYRRHILKSEVGGYTLIGDIAVISLKYGVDMEYYKYIGNKLLNELPRIKSVYLKEAVEGVYRLPRLIHIAGEKRTKTMFKEYGLLFHLDISKVYVNPRLAYEHRMIAEDIPSNARVLDMFSGIGGFSIHIAVLNNVNILSSDINPHAVYYLYKNYLLNRKKIRGYISMLRVDAAKLPYIVKPVFTHIIMNNPTFSKHFAGVACRLANKNTVIYYYTLNISSIEAEEEALNAFTSGCGSNVSINVIGSREVIEYSPTHSIFRVKLSLNR